MRNADTCLMCGRYVPEGRYVCILCERDQDRQRSGTVGADLYKQYDTIAVDFDGTLCENRFPEIGEPKPRIISFIRQHAARGSKIILYTCRENGTRRALLDEAVAFCEKYNIPLFAVNENPANPYPEQYGTGAGRKIYADLYIDDKAVSAADIERAQAEWETIPARIADVERRMKQLRDP